MTSSRRVLATTTILIAFGATPGRAADPAANFLVRLFAEVCVPNMGQPGKVRDWANQKRLPSVTNPTALTVFVGKGDKGEAWFLPSKIGNFALSIRGTTEACAVWASEANPAESDTLFRKIIDGVKRPGLEVTVLDEKKISTPTGEARSLVYGVRPAGQGGFAFTLLTSEKAGGPFQVSMQVARATFK
jgi:hypothetical protein